MTSAPTARPPFPRRVFDALSSGDWLTRERLRVYPVMVLALWVIVSAAWFATTDGVLDRTGKVVGTDFINVWAASDLALAGRPAEVYDYRRHDAAQQKVVGPNHPHYYGWHYPPMFLLVALPLALLPYIWSLLTYLAVTAPAYWATLRAIVPGREAMVAALAFPGVWVNLGHGQNGFLTVGLLGGGLLLLERRPVVAGALLGLLAYKPQFGLLIPLALAARGCWVAFGAAAVAVAGTAAVSAAVFGLDTWRAFFDSLDLTRTYIVERGSTGWPKIQSVFSAVRILGGGVGLAYLVQTAAILAAATAVVVVWRRCGSARLRAATLVAAIPFTSPYLLDYDLVILALPIAFLVAEAAETGVRPWEKTALVAVWLLPMLSRPLGVLTSVQITPVVLAILLTLLVRRALRPA